MPSDRSLDAVRKALGGRALIWFGIRGEDGEALLRLPELSASFSLIAPLRSASLDPQHNVALELLAGSRPDLDRYDLDIDESAATREFRRRLLLAVSRRCVVATYRPSALTSGLTFAMSETMALAGPFHDRQAAFEHKPWVETALARRGVVGLGWRYVADEHRGRVKRLVSEGPQILRASRASGGVGIERVATEEDVDRHWPVQADTFVAVSRYLEPSIPLNLSGCVFDSGAVRLHPPSIQLIGISSCTDRRFGYCGNDFGSVRELDDDVLVQFDRMGQLIGSWLHEERYRGAFGIDALVHEGRVRFIEVNPRFQGSSALSAEIAIELGTSDLFLDHLAATLGIGPTGLGLSVLEWARRQPAAAQIVVHNIAQHSVVRDTQLRAPELPARVELAQFARDIAVEPGGALCRLVLPRSVTSIGTQIDDSAAGLVTAMQGHFVRQ